MAKYSREQRDRAVDLYIKYERCAADVIRELGHPGKGALLSWYADRLEEERPEGTPVRSSSSRSRYHTYRIVLLGYPSSWITSAALCSYLMYKSTARSRCCLLYVMPTLSLTQRAQENVTTSQ